MIIFEGILAFARKELLSVSILLLLARVVLVYDCSLESIID